MIYTYNLLFITNKLFVRDFPGVLSRNFRIGQKHLIDHFYKWLLPQEFPSIGSLELRE